MTTHSPALSAAHAFLRIFLILTWIMVAALLALLFIFPNELWILKSFGIAASPDTDRLVLGLRAMAVCGIAALVLNTTIIRRLLAMIATVRAGDPFVSVNAERLQGIAWTLVGLQVISLTIAAIARTISSPAHPVRVDAGFSINGWLAVLLTFVLARVFAEGARMRDELEGTV
jgi:hypothetical protein